MGTTVISTRLDEETYRRFVEAVKMNRGPDVIVSDVLRELIVDFIPMLKQQQVQKEQGFQQNAVSERGSEPSALKEKTIQQPRESITERGSEAALLHQGPGEEHGIDSETSYKVGGQQCPFYSFNVKQKLVHCSKDYIRKNGLIHRVIPNVCEMCWECVQSKRQRPQEDTPDAIINNETPQNHSNESMALKENSKAS